MRYRATVAYVGTFFHGWQIQENVSRTVQACVERSLAKIFSNPIRAHASGRTDSGVHADGQVIHFDAPELPPEELLAAANNFLPWDVRLLSVGRAADDFHARLDAVGKRYVYRFSREPVIAPRDALFWAPLSPRARAPQMAEAGRLLVGRHDFLAFSTAGTETETTVRTLSACEISEDGPRVTISLTADGFLRGMARAIAGTLAAVGRGKSEPDLPARILAASDKSLVPAKAKPRGLTLEQVFYD